MRRLSILAGVLTFASLTTAAEGVPRSQIARAIDFSRDVQPILTRHCAQCHGPKRQRNGYRLDRRAEALRGGDSGEPAIVPGHSGESPLIERVAASDPALVMPPKGRRLTPDQVGLLRAWVDQGARWSESGSGELATEPPHWSLRPLVKPAVPRPKDDPRARTPIDAFILAKLDEAGLSPSPEADRPTLVRRLTFDLTGLPPTPEEVDAFVADASPEAYLTVVDRLLASPRYGERWARHWMDVIHFAETHGNDQDRPRPNAWPYRDYLIRSFNDDKPYARFVQEQVAGDVLWPGDPQATVALGFLAAGPWDESSQRDIQDDTVDKRIAQNLDRDDMVATTMSAFVSATVHCARCHNHKFDPIAQKEYYALQAVFAGVDRADRPYGWIDPKAEPIRQFLVAKKNERQQADLPPALLVYAATRDFKPEGSFHPAKTPRPIYVLKRGDLNNPGEQVALGALSCVPGLSPRFELANPDDEGARRAALARWLSDPRNVLTWRSIVNRVWHYHFGRGLADSPNDLGRMGAAPTHPELLDWLAVSFRDGGGSLKSLHRQIVTSAVYRQSSRHDPKAALVDADNLRLWRMNRTRLDAESVRDAVLQVAGKLDLTMGGPSVKQFIQKPGVHVTPLVDYDGFDVDSPPSCRRSVYRFLFRTLPDPFMESMDCPDASQFSPKRNNSVTVLQALAMLNNHFIVRQSEHFAARVGKSGPDLGVQIDAACRLAWARPPTATESKALRDYAARHGMANLCRFILNSNEFLFIN